ncbi:C-GCAxxG-C-C family protein [Terrisporobacter petrolearius]|uniref:DVU_1555 family C-GCAxxG-C-C protein n=1 Tax=Terrisporobacter petrolearius TaxID=1460447 RepID=UPI001D164CD4|nr:DV_1555 family C-GCAxxG-C-C protein [Terrisporobacter petrolearius]MCC3862884.1 C-GCAxxG-C-C family protein [Terrisporobacter petrolearius]
MDELYMEMLELSSKGYYCSQILMKIILDLEGKENPDLIRAMGGLIGGLGFNQKICGAFTGGVCILGYFASKGEDEEIEDENLSIMTNELIEWFENEGSDNKGINCGEILDGNFDNKSKICPNLVLNTFEKVVEILNKYGYEL